MNAAATGIPGSRPSRDCTLPEVMEVKLGLRVIEWVKFAKKCKYDAQRTRDLEQQGLKVFCLEDRQALLQTESVLEGIFQAVKNPS